MPNFALEDPEIFNNVLPWNLVTQETTPEAVRGMPRNSAKLLQEKVEIVQSEFSFKFIYIVIVLF